ncbi:MAG TPA: glycosyltransferase family 4 protein [Pyrinomonadaceae bacterium]|nr:glycosyltransferase family 4 protein [Pyrinomonadaceae bacterium]
MKRRLRITFVVPAIGSGGAEHALVLLARRWSGTGRSITILTYDDGSEAPFYELADNIKHVPLNLARVSNGFVSAVKNNLIRLRILRRALKDSRPNVIVSFIDQTNVLTLVAAMRLDAKVIVVEQSDPRKSRIKPAWARLRLWAYSRAHRIVTLSDDDAKFFPVRLRGLVKSIPNPFQPPRANGHDRRSGRTESLIGVGRLHRDKGFDVLLRAFSTIAESHPGWHLTIVGDGDERSELEKLRDELGLANRVFLPGRVKDPYIHLKQASLFVLPSRVEGFPLALCEALACGLTAVATDCAGGVRDIIRNGENGVLVPVDNAAELARELSRLMGDEAERQRLSARARDVLENFNPDKTFAKWETLLQEVVDS